METERMALRQRKRDRLRVLHEVKQKQITQIEAAKRLKISDRHIRRLLLRLRLHSALGYRSPSQQWLKPPRAQLWCSSGVDSGKRKNFLGRGDLTPSQDSQYPGETEGKFKLLQMCPRNLSHCRGAPQQKAASVPKNLSHYRGSCQQTGNKSRTNWEQTTEEHP